MHNCTHDDVHKLRVVWIRSNPWHRVHVSYAPVSLEFVYSYVFLAMLRSHTFFYGYSHQSILEHAQPWCPWSSYTSLISQLGASMCNHDILVYRIMSISSYHMAAINWVWIFEYSHPLVTMQSLFDVVLAIVHVLVCGSYRTFRRCTTVIPNPSIYALQFTPWEYGCKEL